MLTPSSGLPHVPEDGTNCVTGNGDGFACDADPDARPHLLLVLLVLVLSRSLRAKPSDPQRNKKNEGAAARPVHR